ncbi:MAG TPA: HisS family protein, partial [Clostridia bacterium]|nr:HisS family protein [Clostridia bacterium]
DAENLTRSEGGDNLGLVYQVLKRGEKLQAALESGEQLWDLGLRYDLTLPLARFYACNRAKLPEPFKSIQMGRAYRAERPQKGRLREFIQCDIDILGTDSPMAERELIAVTAEALLALGFEGFTLHVNDRRVLRALLDALGFAQEDHASALIALDKLDKIGLSGVAEELSGRDLPANAVNGLVAFLGQPDGPEALRSVVGSLPELEALENLAADANALGKGKWTATLDRTLVRGQGYYTGTIFEITLPGYPGSVAGGGRYDGMIGKFTGQPTPAVGFSIGFERIVSLLLERPDAADGPKRLALLYGQETPFPALFEQMRALAEAYVVEALPLQDNAGKQLKRLSKAGYQAVKRADEADVRPLW